MIKEDLFELSLPYDGKRSKTVRVFVPAHEEGESLPVIYMTDGQNLFEDDRPLQYGCWYTREALRGKRQKSGKTAIIVGIHNDEGPMERGLELTPGSMGTIRYPEEIPEEIIKTMVPKGEDFDRFVIDTVMPEIEKGFPVKTGRENTAFCGSSLGGIMSYYSVLTHPDRFCMGGVFSPAFPMFVLNDVINWTKSNVRDNAPFLFIYSGSGDKMEQDICKITEAFYDSVSKFYPKDKLTKRILPERPHHESAWAEAFKEFLSFFFSESA